MKIIAIDPGYDRVGIAVLERDEKKKEHVLFSECFQTSKDTIFTDRLGQLGQHIKMRIHEFNIEALVIEDLFFAKNTKTALKVSEARGVINFQAYDAGVPIY
jgi:crossover junction endodeoxyribonuclease RuvC